jgi:hypothetical protein
MSDLEEIEIQVREQELARAAIELNNRRRRRAQRIRSIGLGLRALWGAVFRDLGALVGVGLLSYGAWQAYPPAGYIVGGALLLAGAVISGSRE